MQNIQATGPSESQGFHSDHFAGRGASLVLALSTQAFGTEVLPGTHLRSSICNSAPLDPLLETEDTQISDAQCAKSQQAKATWEKCAATALLSSRRHAEKKQKEMASLAQQTVRISAPYFLYDPFLIHRGQACTEMQSHQRIFIILTNKAHANKIRKHIQTSNNILAWK